MTLNEYIKCINCLYSVQLAKTFLAHSDITKMYHLLEECHLDEPFSLPDCFKVWVCLGPPYTPMFSFFASIMKNGVARKVEAQFCGFGPKDTTKINLQLPKNLSGILEGVNNSQLKIRMCLTNELWNMEESWQPIASFRTSKKYVYKDKDGNYAPSINPSDDHWQWLKKYVDISNINYSSPKTIL